jgi:hypothetical protein
MSLLTICIDAADQTGQRRPASVIGNSDPIIQQFLNYAQLEGKRLPTRGEWQGLRTPATFTSLASEVQTGMIPTDFARFINETFWNRSRRRPLQGPVTPQQWQNIQAWTTSPVQDTFTVYGSDIYITPAPPAGQTLAFEYVSSNFCKSAGGTLQSSWLADTDTARIPEEIFSLGIAWRYLEKIGQGRAQQLQAEYETRIKQLLTNDQPRRKISLSEAPEYGLRPGIAVPEGYWNA